MISNARDWNFDIDHHLNQIIPSSRIHRLPAPISRWLGHRAIPKKDVGNLLQAFWSFVGAFLGLAVIAAIFNNSPPIQGHHPPIFIASFVRYCFKLPQSLFAMDMSSSSFQGASAVLEYNVIKSPLGQPRNALLGHTFSALVGVAVTKLFLYHEDFEKLRWIAGAIACGLASAVMLLTNTVHPPGGASALLAATLPEVTNMGWYFVGLVMLGTVLMLLVSLITNNIQRQFPTYWWTPVDLRDMRLARKESVPDGKGAIEPKDSESSIADMDQICISAAGVELPRDLSLNAEEAELLERLRERLRLRQEDEKQGVADDSSASSTIHSPEWNGSGASTVDATSYS